MIKQRRARNRITQILDTIGNVVEDEEGLVAFATNYFRQIFESYNPEGIKETFYEVSTTITESFNEDLTCLVIECEVKLALFGIHPEKAIEPEGMTALLYQKF